jgi:2-polyprenyl-3-methyl-5-hydroxy-6-metoxy-1,4-benzoquinol methylase
MAAGNGNVKIYADDRINEHGFWSGDIIDEHAFDPSLAEALADFFSSQPSEISIADFGCGPGEYTKKLLSKGLNCKGYDGNP